MATTQGHDTTVTLTRAALAALSDVLDVHDDDDVLEWAGINIQALATARAAVAQALVKDLTNG